MGVRAACVLVVGLLAVEWSAAPSLPVPPEDPKPPEPIKVPPQGKPSAEHLEKLRDKLRELNPNMEDKLPPLGGRGGRGGRGSLPDLSKVGEKLKSLKDLKGNVKDKIKLPKLQSKSKLPLEYNLSSFLEVYAGPRHGTEPTAHPKHDRSHADFDPFEIPMPTLKAEWSPEDAFAKMDEDGDGIVKGREFRAISESGMFNVMPTENFKNFAVFGMSKELFLELHGSELEAAGHTAEELFGKHDADGDERFDREEYSAFKSLLKEL